ncbi:PAS domain-containing protein [Microvirga sp. GCM10011540]|uniref:PAS domain-containing sensor histidine kinase n=1 Tax=Microvirga sp. GCM10011540 TaxID=3317338 RepID=UPI003614689E
MLMNFPAKQLPAVHDFLQGGGQMGARMRAHDWSTSPLGEPAHWPQSLRNYVELMLNARQAMFVAWGPELAFLYNDDYAPIFGVKHPGALGRPFAEVWADIWGQIGPIVEQTLSGQASWFEDLLIPMERHGRREDAWFSFSYTPIRDESGQVAGMFCAAVETTGKVLAERRAMAERERLQQLFQQAPSFMAMVRGPDHVFELVNSSYQQLIGHREVLGMPVREALPELVEQGFIELLDEVYRTGKAFIANAIPISLQQVPSGGDEQRFLNFVYQPITDASGQVTGIFGEGYDVTEQVKAEQALRVSEEFNRRILESSSDCIKVLDTNAQLQFMSTGGMEVMEVVDFGAIQSCDWRSFWYGPEHAKAREAVETALAGGMARFQGPTPTFRGTLKWWDVAVTPITGPDGKVEKILSVSRDISDLKKVEEALRKSEARHRAIIEATPECVKLVAVDGKVLEMNPAGLAMLEIDDPAMLKGASVLDVIAPEFRQEWRANHARVCKGESVNWEFDIISLKGTRRHMETHAVPLTMPDGSVAHLAVTRDISARKRGEEHQKLLINELNHRVKNTLASVQSITVQTLRTAATADSAKEALEGRLLALSRAHDVLTRENWEGAGLREIIGQAAEPYSSGQDRLHVDGPEVRLSPRMALALAMALQELATNAVKYGALSNLTGQVRIAWKVEQNDGQSCLHLEWAEKGGPPVQVPKRRGFGTRLIERSLAHDLGGTAQVSFEPDGLRCTVHAPLT